MYRKTVLDNGLRVVAERMPALKSVTIGIWVNVGSRDEEPGEEGISHFIEHMFFKGTRTRSAADISREIDALGGELNAFTSRETTTFYVKVVDQQVKPALALLSDLFQHSRFAAREVEKEKDVVLEEIRAVQDDPEDLVQEIHTQQSLPAHPLGRSILGTAKSIRALRREQILRYIRKHYHPAQTIVAVAGNFEPKELIPLLEESFGGFTRAQMPQLNRWPPQVKGGVLVQHKPLEQAHLCLGFKGIPIDHKDRYASHVLNAVLGGSVSSRLFQKIREERGLAYTIYSFLCSYSDGGTLTIYAATRPHQAARVVELICREVNKLRAQGVTRHELETAKNHLKGSLMLSVDSTHSRMSKLAKDELYSGRYIPLEEMLADIEHVTGERVLHLSRQLLDHNSLSVTALGPVSRRSVQIALA